MLNLETQISIRGKMDKEKLESNLKTLREVKDIINNRIAELDKQIEAIESSPVSVDEYLKPFISDSKKPDSDPYCQRCWVQGQREGFKAGEQNDRKRTRPLIDAVKEWAEMTKGFNQSSLYEESKAILKALKTLEEYDSQA